MYLLKSYVNLLVCLIYLVIHLSGAEFFVILLILLETCFKTIITIGLRTKAAAAKVSFSHSIGGGRHLVCIENGLSVLYFVQNSRVMVLITKRVLSIWDLKLTYLNLSNWPPMVLS